MADLEPVVLKDRSSWLTFFGVVELVLGVLSSLFIPLMLLSLSTSRRGELAGAPSLPLRTLLPGLILYGLLAVFWISMGIGSLKGTRWARALTLIASWLWFIAGTIVFFTWLYTIPNMTRVMKEAGGNIPDNFIRTMMLVQGIFLGIFFIALPLIFIAFYGSAGVKATVERRDPRLRWTDRIPLPVLALCLFLVLGAAQAAFTISMGIGLPVFGKFFVGLPMVIITLGVSLVLLYLAWSTYHLKMIGWFGTLVMVVLGTVSSFITFRNIDMMELYSRMGYQGKQLEMMKKFQIWNSTQMAWSTIIYLLLAVGFLWYIRGYFKPNAQGTGA